MIKKGLWNTKRGVALLLVISILGLLVLIGTSFALNMLLTRKEAANFLNSVRARYIAEAGINRALADMRSRVKTDSYGNLTAYINGYVAASGTDVAFGQGTYTLSFSTDTSGNVISEADKVNINSFDEFDASQINILNTAGLTNRDIALIIDYRDYDSNPTLIPGPPPGNGVENAGCKGQPYGSIEEVKAAFVNGGATVAAANTSYNLIKDKITVHKPIMRGGLLAKYFSNITGTSPNVQIDTSSFKGEVVELGDFEEHYVEGADGDNWDTDSGWTESHDAEFSGGYLVAAVGDFGLESFGVIYEGYIEILPSEVGSPVTFRVQVDDGARIFINEQSILPASSWQDQGATNYSGNYTFQSPGWHRIRIEYYDNTSGDTIRIRWGGADFNSATVIPAERFGYEAPTEKIPASATLTVYNNAGNYNITCTAKVTSGIQVLAQKRLSAVIRFFGTWAQTTRDEFYAAWFNDYAAGIPAGYTNSDGALPGSGGNDYRDGEMRNVTWLDSCPLNATDNLEASGYFSNLDDAAKFKRDSLKLGFWSSFDDDPTSSVVFLKALVRSEKWGSDTWINVTKDIDNEPQFPPADADTDPDHKFFYISWGDIKDNWPVGAPDGNNELVIKTSWHEGRRFEVDPFYYFPSQSNPGLVSGQPNVFMRGWTAIDPAPGSEAKAYWKGNGAELIVDPLGPTPGFDGFDGSGNPYGARVYAGIPVSGGVEQNNTAYTGDGSTGYGYDADGDTLYDIDAATGLSERICKVWPAGSHAPASRKAIYNAARYYISNQTNPYSYWQPDVPFTTAMIYACGERMDSVSGSGFGQGSTGFGLLTKDNDTYWDGIMRGWTYPEDNDILELTLDSSTGSSPPYNDRINWMGSDFKASPVLAIIGSGVNYVGYQRYTAFNKKAPQILSFVTATTSVSVPNFQFLSRNVYDANDAWNVGQDWPKWMVPNVYIGAKWLGRTGGNADQFPGNPINPPDNTGMTTFWDNIRIIPQSGFLVSSPHVARSSTDADAAWGTVSWTEDKPANTDVKIYLRSTSTGLPTSDNFSALYTNGAQIGGAGRVIQYKVILSSTAFDPNAAWGSNGGITPRLDDIAITYNPTVQVLYWREF